METVANTSAIVTLRELAVYTYYEVKVQVYNNEDVMSESKTLSVRTAEGCRYFYHVYELNYEILDYMLF